MLINCSCTTSIDNSLFEFTKLPRRSKPDAHSHLLVWTYRERRVGLYATWAFLWVSQRQHHQVTFVFNSNNDKTYKVTPMIESLRTTQIAFFKFATPSGFLGGRRRGTKSIRARENPMKPFVRTSFLGTRPSCLPSPGRRFFCTDDRKPNFWLGRRGSPVNS